MLHDDVRSIVDEASRENILIDFILVIPKTRFSHRRFLKRSYGNVSGARGWHPTRQVARASLTSTARERIACTLGFCIRAIHRGRARDACVYTCVRRRLRRATLSLVLAPSHSLQSHVRHRHLSLCAAYTCWQRTRIQVMPLSQRDGS